MPVLFARLVVSSYVMHSTRGPLRLVAPTSQERLRHSWREGVGLLSLLRQATRDGGSGIILMGGGGGGREGRTSEIE